MLAACADFVAVLVTFADFVAVLVTFADFVAVLVTFADFWQCWLLLPILLQSEQAVIDHMGSLFLFVGQFSPPPLH